jgi:hypothetical protein
LLADRVVGDVSQLMAEVFFITDTVLVIAAVPDFSGRLLAYGERVSTFNELNAPGCGLVDCRRDENVDVVGHDDKAVEVEAAFVSVLEECGDEEFGVGCSLEVPVALEGQDGDGVGALLLSDGGHAEESILQGLKPFSFGPLRGPSLKAWLT